MGLQRLSDAASRPFSFAPRGLRRFWHGPALLSWPRSISDSGAAFAPWPVPNGMLLWLRDDRVSMVIRDDGRGIPKGIIERIFDPYYTTSRDSGGSGLGLYIVHNIVTGVFNGRISAARAPGGGAQFTITMPIGEGMFRYAAK